MMTIDTFFRVSSLRKEDTESVVKEDPIIDVEEEVKRTSSSVSVQPKADVARFVEILI